MKALKHREVRPRKASGISVKKAGSKNVRNGKICQIEGAKRARPRPGTYRRTPMPTTNGNGSTGENSGHLRKRG